MQHPPSAVTTELDALLARAMALTEDDRAELIERLAATLQPATELHPDWAAEIERRVSDLDAGLTASIPAEQVMAELRAMIEAHPHRT